MAGISAGLEMSKNELIELNNNQEPLPALSVINHLPEISSEVSVSSQLPVSVVTDSFMNKFAKHKSLQDLLEKKYSDTNIPGFQRGRSNSDGAAIALHDNAEAFPSLPLTVLKKMGLYGDVPRERLGEENLEQKFTSLSLAFNIDAATIKDRCERQRRTRDQTETNFNLEVEKLKEKLALLQPLCTDFDRAELLSTLFAQVETLTKAASLVSMAGERFGAVQHEERLTESVHLMVSHVQALKQQRDSARRQLQYTKRFLQEPIQPDLVNGITNQKKSTGSANKSLITKRRASIDPANLCQQQEHNFNFNRRISDLSFRATLAKSNRPRLELGKELNEIKEISQDDHNKDSTSNEISKVTSRDILDEKLSEPEMESNMKIPYRCLAVISHLLRKYFPIYLEAIREKLGNILNKWPANGYLHALLNSWAVLCFSISILTLASIFLEQEYVGSFSILPWHNRKDCSLSE